METRADGSGERLRRDNSTFAGHRDHQLFSGRTKTHEGADATTPSACGRDVMVRPVPRIFFAPQTLPRPRRIETVSCPSDAPCPRSARLRPFEPLGQHSEYVSIGTAFALSRAPGSGDEGHRQCRPLIRARRGSRRVLQPPRQRQAESSPGRRRRDRSCRSSRSGVICRLRSGASGARATRSRSGAISWTSTIRRRGLGIGSVAFRRLVGCGAAP